MIKTLPPNLMITNVSITNYHRSYGTESMSGVRVARDTGIQWFKGSVTLQAYGYANVRLLNGFLSNLKGKLHHFTLPLKGAYVNPDIGSNPVLYGSHSKGTTVLNMTHVGTLIGMGSVFTIPNEPKLYTLNDNIDGAGSYSVTPALKIDHSSAEVLNFIDPQITAVLDSNETTISHEGNGLMASASLTWTEAII